MSLDKSVAEKYEMLEDTLTVFFTPGQLFKYLLINGPPGLGKSYSVSQIYKAVKVEFPNIQIHVTKGHITPGKLYELLLKFNTENDIHIFDDADGTLTNLSAQNYLKAASDVGTDNIVTSFSPRASEPEFRFLGKILILTNHVIRNTKASNHFKAILSRFQTFELALNQLEIVSRLEWIVLEGGTFDDMGEDIRFELLAFIEENSPKFKDEITLRTFNNLYTLAMSFPTKWERHAKYQLLN